MTATFSMPVLGADMAAGTLNRWCKHPGDSVRHGDIIAEVETDKGVIDVECFADGVIDALLVEPGAQVPVGTPLATIREAQERKGAAPSAAAPSSAAVAAAPRDSAPQAGSAGAALVSPTASRLAAARGIDVTTIRGTGTHGRVLRRDVEAALTAPVVAQEAHERPVAPAAQKPRPGAHATPRAREVAAAIRVDLGSIAGSGPGGWIMRRDVEAASSPTEPAPDPRVRMRRAIAAAMSRSNAEVPHYHVTWTIDLERAVRWLADENERRSVKERFLLAIVLVRAVALAMRETTSLNAVWKDEQVVPSDRVHVGMAISLRGGGLVAPALHDADTRSLEELMHAFVDLVKRARQGGLRSSELSDATVTVTNLGEQGAESVAGVIFPPQVALVGFGRVAVRPWVDNGTVVPRTLVTATLSADHRVSDGHEGSRFLAALDRRLQEPETL